MADQAAIDAVLSLLADVNNGNGNLADALNFAADSGVIPLSFDDAILARHPYRWADILAGEDEVFPKWFTPDQNHRWLVFDQIPFCNAFIKARRITRHNGAFMVDGVQKSDNEIKRLMIDTITIIMDKPGNRIDSDFRALCALVEDDAPRKTPQPKTRLTLATFAEEMRTRGYSVRLNVISREYEIDGRTETGRVLTDEDLLTLMYDALADDYKGVSFDIMGQYLAFMAREDQYNPVLDLLSSTEWDGVDRLPQIYNLLGIEDDELSVILVRKWLYQSVAILFNDIENPFSSDCCLVLNGRELGRDGNQGAGKTSFFRHLALRNVWFGEGCSIDDRDKDTKRRVVTKWISELGEVESTFKSDIARLKAFISNPTVAYRLPYAKKDIVTPRITSLCATCNSDQYLIDTTGNRRWWSIPLRKKIPREDLLKLDALQLWAQIYAVVSPMTYADKAACFRLTDDELTLLDIRNGDFEKPQKAQCEVTDILTQATRDNLTFVKMTVSEFKARWDVLRPYSAQQISAALKACGIETTHTKYGSVAELPTPTPAFDTSPFTE